MTVNNAYLELRNQLEGSLYFEDTGTGHAHRLVYATDASVYQEKPVAVAIPKTNEDIKKLIQFANNQNISLIPRAAGTSLAGQVVGAGLVVDISKHFDKIIEINVEEKWVRVQPGVIRDDLNKALAKHNLFFGPETSTASRAMIGGMVGNNSCGLHSIVWGTTRDHLLEVKGYLSDGSDITFGMLSDVDFKNKSFSENEKETLENKIYKTVSDILLKPNNQELIKNKFPKKTVTRRNTGYALDALLNTSPFSDTWEQFNLCKLIAGSEGTLCFMTEIKLNLLDLPPKNSGLLCIHCTSLQESLEANLVAMAHKPYASELVDKFILDFTLQSNEYRPNRFFIEGNPEAILMVEFFAETQDEIHAWAERLIMDLKQKNLGYAFPLLMGDDSKKAMEVRKGGLGLLRNMPGDVQPVNLIEDCAVAVEDLPNYIRDLQQLLDYHGVKASYYAHAGAGELHVEPMLNLKTSKGKKKFRTILEETTLLVKKYKGSLSGEHGDGRLRGEFIPSIMGPEIYALFERIKEAFDPNGIFNHGKITDTPPMNEFLRVSQDQAKANIVTYFNYDKQESILRLTEKCSGSGDCRKTELTGGTMCPSYMATRLEKNTTRARANMLRQYLSNQTPKGNLLPDNIFVPETDKKAISAGKVAADEVKEVFDLCLSCKGCKAECPSSVDVGKLKAEFYQHYFDKYGTPLRTLMIGNFTKLTKIASKIPWAYNFLMNNAITGSIAKKIMGFAPKRSIPNIANVTLEKWQTRRKPNEKDLINPKTGRANERKKKILLFCDEFTNYNDVEVGQKFILLFEKLGYQVVIPTHIESGRTFLSKGMLREAQNIAIKNVNLLFEAIQDGTAIVGIEPSAILTLREEYLELVPKEMLPMAEKVAENTYLFDEYFAQEIDKKNIKKDKFSTEKKLIKLHGHCYQKALSSLTPSKKVLSLPDNFEVQLIPSGCCGMAGSFGYEAEHYDLSMQIGELVLFPTIRKQTQETIIAAAGTSCRHQIKDGTGRIAKHPIEIMYDALIQ